MSERRTKVPFNPYYFEQQAAKGRHFSLPETFERIYESRHWNSPGSISGEGAGETQTAELKTALPPLLRRLGVKTLLDVPCGDFGWMSEINLPIEKYIGVDIVPQLVERNKVKYQTQQRSFMVADITRDELPAGDLLLCRDCFVHFSFQDISAAIANIKRGETIKYLLTTTFLDCKENEDIVSGDWRVLNLEKPPFYFPPPLLLIDEKCSEGNSEFKDKFLGLWLLESVTP